MKVIRYILAICAVAALVWFGSRVRQKNEASEIAEQKAAGLKAQADQEQRQKQQQAAEAEQRREEQVADFIKHVTYRPLKRDYEETRYLKNVSCSTVLKSLGKPDIKEQSPPNGYSLVYGPGWNEFECLNGTLLQISIGKEGAERIGVLSWYGPVKNFYAQPGQLPKD